MRQDIKEMVEGMEKLIEIHKPTPETLRYVFKVIRARTGLITVKRPRKLPTFLNDEEMEIVKVKSLDEDITTQMLISILMQTGVRISEARNLDIRDIDYSNYQLKVVSGKGSKDRHVPLSSPLMMQMKAFLRERKKGYFFIKEDQTPFSIRALQDRVKKVYKKCKFDKKLKVHSLRHTYATWLIRKGMSIEKVQILMGHANIEMTQIYNHLELGDVKKDYMRIAEMSS